MRFDRYEFETRKKKWERRGWNCKYGEEKEEKVEGKHLRENGWGHDGRMVGDSVEKWRKLEKEEPGNKRLVWLNEMMNGW